MSDPRRLRDDREFLLGAGIRFEDEESSLSTHDMDAMKARLEANLASGVPTVMGDTPGVLSLSGSARLGLTLLVGGVVAGWAMWSSGDVTAPPPGVLPPVAETAAAEPPPSGPLETNPTPHPFRSAGQPVSSLAPRTPTATVAVESEEPAVEPIGTPSVDTPVEPVVAGGVDGPPKPGITRRAPVRRARPVVGAEEPAAAIEPVQPEAEIEPVVEEPAEEEPAQEESAQEEPAPGEPAEHSDLAEQLALYERGKSALSSGDLSAAVAAFTEYRERFPAGHLRREATLSLLEAYVRSGRHGKAERLARKLLNAGGLGSRRPELLRVRGEALIRLGRCDDAALVLVDAISAGARGLTVDGVEDAVAHCKASRDGGPR